MSELSLLESLLLTDDVELASGALLSSLLDDEATELVSGALLNDPPPSSLLAEETDTALLFGELSLLKSLLVDETGAVLLMEEAIELALESLLTLLVDELVALLPGSLPNELCVDDADAPPPSIEEVVLESEFSLSEEIDECELLISSPGSIGGVDEIDENDEEEEEEEKLDESDELLKFSPGSIGGIDVVDDVVVELGVPPGFLGKPPSPPQAVKPAMETSSNAARFFMVSPYEWFFIRASGVCC